ncbi:hypothetical protein, partial [Nodularia spumigena]|uniref:hypothetical protein n=1 Tax=Nodularia spumigena TaxID=70799 RepID=UPI0005CA13E9
YVDSFLRVFDEDGNDVIFSDDDLAFNSSLVYTEFTDNEYPSLVFPTRLIAVITKDIPRGIALLA